MSGTTWSAATRTLPIMFLLLAITRLAGSGEPISPLWKVDLRARGVPATDAEGVYVLTSRHEVAAVNPRTGDLRWRQSLGRSDGPVQGSTVVVTSDLVIAGDYDVFALERRTGKLLWRFEPVDGYGPGIYLGEVAGELAYTGSPAGRIYAIDLARGTERWSAVVNDDGKSTVFQPVTDGRLVVAAYTSFDGPLSGGVVAFDPSGRARWRRSFPRSAPATMTNAAGGPILTRDLVLAASGDGIIHAFDRDTGATRWTLPGVQTGSGVADFRALSVTDRTLVAGSLNGALVSYDLETLTERWRVAPRPGLSVGFAVASATCCLYVPYLDGTLVALDLRDGSERWRIGDWRNGFRWRPAIDGTRVFLTSSDGELAAFVNSPVETPSSRWERSAYPGR